MKKNRLNLVVMFCLAGLLILGLLTLGPNQSWAPQMIKVGVVNWERTVSNYQQFQEEISELQTQRERWRAAVEQIDSDRNDEDQDEIYQEALEQINSQLNRVIREAHRHIYEVIEEVAITNGYSLVLSENEVLYASEAYTDLTEPVLRRLNAD